MHEVLEQTRKLLGIEFKYSNGSIQIHQSTHTAEVYECFYIFQTSNFFPTNFLKLDCLTDNLIQVKMSKLPYRSVIGRLIYIMPY